MVANHTSDIAKKREKENFEAMIGRDGVDLFLDRFVLKCGLILFYDIIKFVFCVSVSSEDSERSIFPFE